MDIKEKLQRFFDKDIYSISENNGLYYVTLDERSDDIIGGPVYVVDLNKATKQISGIPLPELEKYTLIYTKFNQGG